jgi:hypothetical protein
MKVILWLSQHSDQIIDALTAIVTGASALAALTPTPKDDTFMGKAYKVVDWLAFNVGKAKETGNVKETKEEVKSKFLDKGSNI